MRFTRLLAACWIAATLFGCDEPVGGAPPSVSAPASGVASTTASVGPLASAAPSASASAVATTGAGRYEGSYSPTTPTIALEAGVKVPEWKPSGEQEPKGRVVMEIDGSGQITGSVEGALGPGTIVGLVDGPDVSGTLVPRDPDAGMHGTFVGTLRDRTIEGVFRAASGDARAVRLAEASLTRAD